MSEAMVPSYRVERGASGVPWRMLALVAGVLALVGAGAAGWWAFKRMGASGVPVVEADPRPVRIRPGDPGGLRVPNQDELVLERPGQRTAAVSGNRQAALAPAPEAPNLGGLRAAVAPPPPAATPPAAAPSAPPVARAGAPAVTAAVPAPAPAAATAPARPAPAAAAPPPATPAAQPAPRPAANGRTLVQLAAVASEESARSEWDRMARRAPDLFQGRSPTIQKLEREGQPPLFRLRAGGFADQDAARQFCELVRAKGSACVPVR